ncbi:MAG TPA: M20/M25/M40 family metallo-hydrolase, partial [Thermomicrobiaceae bacterium]|nr:M20/M25/M40 family metallo-hydrolase [Thermomicrobiaceae bacterium]
MGGHGERVEEIKRAARALTPAVADLAEQLCLIPAPGYQEEARARFVASQLESRGLSVEIDDIFNVYTRIQGSGNGKALMVSAHTDTVFPAGTPITVERSNGRLTGPAIGDNSAGVACLIGMVDLLRNLNLQPVGDIVLVANVGEEGLGNLRGIRAAVDRFASE